MSRKVTPRQKAAHVPERVNKTKRTNRRSYKVAKHNSRDRNTYAGQRKKATDIPVSNRTKEGTAREEEPSLERIEFCRDRYTLINHATAGKHFIACSHAAIYDEIRNSPVF
ncbi:MAG: hypothetical protein WCS96_07790, partial [Victivallales bacterium]